MNVKLFEIRDDGTFIPVMAIKLSSRNDEERFLLSRSGFGQTSDKHEKYVLMAGINGGNDKIICDPYDWGNRTRKVAHDYIIKHFDTLESGQVIDVQFILGETSEPKLSESISSWYDHLSS